MARARERLHRLDVWQGQQIWLDARADGHSPDERDALLELLRGCAVVVIVRVLILATSVRENP